MKLEATVKKTFDSGKIKAIADVVIDDAIAIHGIKLIEGERGMFLAMPYDQWSNKQGKVNRNDIVHPITAVARSDLYHCVHEAYLQKIEQTEEDDFPFDFPGLSY